jgi:hypothetical protein
MVKQPKTHYKPADEYWKINPRYLYCGGWMYKPKTTGDVNQVTCLRCKGMLAAEMFKFNSMDEWKLKREEG